MIMIFDLFQGNNLVMKIALSNFLKIREWRQWLLSFVVIITIIFGWKYYWISFSVPLVMMINILSLSLKRGRFVCGNLCPRGAFFDRILQPFSQKNRIPVFLKEKKFRLTVLAILFGAFIFQASLPPYNAEHLGHLFWTMCTVTTVLAILLGIFFSHRSWCTFCPIGTILNIAGEDNHYIAIDKDLCVSCKLCEKICPLNLNIIKHKEQGIITDKDCIKCRECESHCPKKALR